MANEVAIKVPAGFKRLYIGDLRPAIYWGWNVEQKLWIRGVYPGKPINEKTAPVVTPIDGKSPVDPNTLL